MEGKGGWRRRRRRRRREDMVFLVWSRVFFLYRGLGGICEGR
jgi:hypothetical protein